MMHKGNLRNKFLIRFLIIGILPIIVLAISGAVILFYARRAAVADLEQKVLAEKQSEINRFIHEETLGAFRIFAGYEQDQVIDFGYDPNTNSYVPEQDAQRFILEGLLTDNSELMEVSMINALMFVSEVGGTAPAKRGAELKRVSRAADIPLNCIPPPNPVTLLLPCEFLVDFSETELFRTAAAGKDYIGPVYWTTEGPMITIAAPIKNKKGTIIVVLRGELRLTRIQTILSSASLGNSGYVFLADDTGKIIARASGAPLLLRADLRKISIVEDTLNGIFRTGLESRDTYANASGISVVGASRPLTALGWALVAEWPYEDAFAELYELINQIITIAVIVIIAIGVFAVVISHQITRPILTLRLGAARFGKGELERHILLSTNDEIEDLAVSLNTMAQDLKKVEQFREIEIRAESLARALEKEKELSREKDVFITTASHQLRTPVSAINWNSELLKDAPIPDDAKELVKGITEHSAFLGAIVNDLLNYATFGPGYTIASKLQAVDVEKAISETLDMLHTEITQKSLTIRTDFPKEKIMATGSYGALRTAIENLLQNAVTYSKNSGTIAIHMGQNEKNEVELRIEDTGIGIPREEQKHLFSPFFRATNAIEQKNVGTGLGLSIVKNIIEGHGGLIAIESERNVGTKIVITLPRSLPAEAPAQA